VDFRLSPARAPAVACDAMVSSSQPLATLSGIDLLRAGGNAVDAALCMAAVLCVTEPHATRVGGDLFAIVRDPAGHVYALDAAGPAPRGAEPEPPATAGPRSVDVPGSVAGWGELSRRFGKAGLERCLRPAIELARRGVAASWNCARAWGASPCAPEAFGPPPPFRIDGDTLSLERPLWDRTAELEDIGFRIRVRTDRAAFGGGQAIIRRDGALYGASDARTDGCALGF
jgi:gamma-glutamyltranspeptidase